MVLVSLKILNTQNLLLERSSITRIGNGVTLTNQCRFLHMDHQCLCHGNLTLICIFCPLWYYNSYMSSPSYFRPNYITYREPVINESPPMHNDRFDHKNRSTQEK
jgi:hypothetical protein